jgi:GntR family transcriptional repressor for pyruvate dehydrogenase complex
MSRGAVFTCRSPVRTCSSRTREWCRLRGSPVIASTEAGAGAPRRCNDPSHDGGDRAELSGRVVVRRREVVWIPLYRRDRDVVAELRFRPARPRRASDDIIGQFREMLERGDLVPGDRLPSERALAEQFAVGRNTVREAIRTLENSGLIILRRGSAGGAFVATPDIDVVTRVYSAALQLSSSQTDMAEAMGWLQRIVVWVACERMSEEDLRGLQSDVEVTSALSASTAWERKAPMHAGFLRLLADATGNPVARIVTGPLVDLVCDLLLAIGPSIDQRVVGSRRRLVGHLRERDAAGAAGEMERHLRYVHQEWLHRVRGVPPEDHV